ncbi:hypothetical protein [Afipia birgiae]|jgi:hypothetical protein|uniref:hypothetical protein n=1 Tax=Afipia birgiae TaxID=151414 RepID=UPI0002E845A3|nr:hypothetical protein [Afipia birgiae]MBX9821252.1 hypothetical protein [Afipia birgiae]
MSNVVAHIEAAQDGAIAAPPADIHDLALLDAQNDPATSELAADIHPDIQIDTPQEPTRDNFKRISPFKRIGRGLLRPLIAVATAQYFIVAVLAGLAAWAIASEAGEVISAKLEPVLAALKRF